MIRIDTGDTVFHRPTRETWLVAYATDRHVCPCGWPESLADLSDCSLVEKATSAERLGLLEDLAAAGGNDSRVRYAIQALRDAPGEQE